MRALAVLLGSFGLVLGLACAVAVHYLPVGAVGFFVYLPPAEPVGRAIGLRLHWFPSLWVLPVIGLVLGVLTAVALGRSRWQLHRT